MSLPITLDSFIDEVKSELTVSCSLPFSPPSKDILRVIKYAEKWFHKKYEDSVEERYYKIPKDSFNDSNFKTNKTIILPECIFSVISVDKVTKGNFNLSPYNQPDFSLEKAFFKNTMDISSSTESLMMYVAFESFIDLSRSMTTHPVSWKFNRNTNELFLAGELPDGDIVLTVYQSIPLTALMKDEIFFRYVVAKCKTQLGRILGTFAFNYIGGVTINIEKYSDEGNEELSKIEEEIKGDEGMDWFFTTGGG